MTDGSDRDQVAPESAPEVEVLEADALELTETGRTPSEREVSTTVGTGSYVAISCTAMALLLTLVILLILFVIRWLS
jgi:hypothetical protein